LVRTHLAASFSHLKAFSFFSHVRSTAAATTDASSEAKSSSKPTIAEMRAKAAGSAKKVGGRKMVINDDDDDDTPVKPVAPKPAPAKVAAAPAKKPAPAAPVKKEETPAKSKPAPKKRKRDEDEDEDDDDDSGSDSESYESDKPKKTAKKAAVKKETPKKVTTKEPAKKKQKGESGEPVKKPAKKTGVKKEGDNGSQDDVYKWWERDPDDERVWTKSLRHHGVLFPPAYVPHGIKMKYNGEPVDLPAEAEEIATYFSRYLTTPHVQKTQFCANFFKDFLKVLNKKSKTKSKIEKFELCDFTPIAAYLEIEKEKKKTRTKEEKEAEKKQKAELKEKYGWAEVDGRREPLGNYMIEPPGLFLGRGDHPKTGRLKKRIMPEDVTLNLDKDAPVPECPVAGHKWGAIQHNQEVAWIATWRENIADNNKYVLFAASSSIRGRSDRDKFETARQLRKHIDSIRSKYEDELDSDELKIQQRATAMWVIDRLALRVGNEKGEDEADTVGCCSLRVEHVKLVPPRTVEFDFLGKDSMRYHNAVEVTDKVFRNFKTFCSGKKPTEDIFDQLTVRSPSSFPHPSAIHEEIRGGQSFFQFC
jgi:DNA topoisomerase I